MKKSNLHKHKSFISVRPGIVFPLLLMILFINIPLSAGSYLKIDKTDAVTDFPKIKIYLTVKDFDNIPASSLNEENILLYEDSYLVNYVKVKSISEAEGILYMIFGIDSSKSISAKLLTDLKKYAEDFLSAADPNDVIALYRFNDESILLNRFTNNRVEILKNINKIERHGTKTLLYNALYDSVELLKKTDSSRKAVIVFTDGKDEGSSIEIDDVIKAAKDSHIPIYCIAFNPQNRIKLLSRLTMLTGGKLFKPDKTSIGAIYKSIKGTTKNQFIAEYKTLLPPDGKSHDIDVKLKLDTIKDRDQIKITYKKKMPAESLSNTEIILLALGVIIILLIILVLLALKYYRKANKSPSNVETYIPVSNAVCDKREKVNIDGQKSGIEKGTGENEAKTEQPIVTKAWLIEREGADAGKKIPVQFEETTIGRNKDNKIILDDKSVSKKHAKIKVIKNSFYLFDMASDKGTYLNENKLLRPKLLYDWDEIRMGKKIFIFRVSNVA
ncbi:MAG: FHA domain-containing protein [Spirochaetota bacterium]